MEHPRVKPRSEPANSDGAYASLDELVRLQYKARGFSFLPRQPVHSILAGRHASRLRGRGLNFEEIRRYLPGDDIRNMDWKITARLQKPHVRVYTEERDRPVLLLVDQRMSMFFGSRRAMKSVVAAEAAALAAWRVLHAGDRVGAIVFGDHEITEVRPHRSEQNVMQILRRIVDQNRSLGVVTAGHSSPREAANAGQFNEALQRANRLATHDFLVCLITDGFGADDTSIRLVSSMCAHNDVMTLFVYDPMEANLPDAGRLVMSEADMQIEINTSDRQVRDSFQQDFVERLTNLQEISRVRSVPFLPIETSQEVAEQVRSLLGHAIESGGPPR